MKTDNIKLKSIIKEAINNALSSSSTNDEELLIDASVDDIELNAVEGTIGYKLNIIINGSPINIDGLTFEAEDKSRISQGAYQLHIILPSSLRQKGIATKLYTTFLTKYGDIVSLYGNRVGTYAASVNKSEDYDKAIDKMLLNTARNTNANIERLFADDKEIGIIVSL